jgi:uncharacterized protein
MLISFTVKNWMCFKEEITFYMEKTRERQHSDRIPRSDANDISILPIGAIYGANASGKSSLYKAIKFAHDFICTPLPKPETKIPINPYKLDDDSRNNPSTFEFDVLINEKRYVYMFSVSKEEVLEEKLVEVRKSGSEKVLFHREKGNDDPRLAKGMKERDRMQYAFKNTRPNMLFLSKTVEDNIDEFRFFRDWLYHQLILIEPYNISSMYKQYDIDVGNKILGDASQIIRDYDTGISNIELMEHQLPEKFINELDKSSENNSYFLYLSNEMKKEILFRHKGDQGKDYFLDEHEQSDGTRRILELLHPMTKKGIFGKRPLTIIIDEIDRSLHTLATRKYIENFLEGCNKDSRDQLIFTTHDILLMDQDILRRDEIHLLDKDEFGSSKLYSLAEFKELRYDLNLMNNYLIGRFDGIPKIEKEL